MAIGSTSSAKADNPAWLPWLVPSIADLIFVALLGVLTCTALSVRLLGDAGIGWHIRTGQLILATHAIPRADPFSSSMAAQPWFAWEWLYDALVGRLERAAGLNAVVLLTALVIALTFSCTFRLLRRRGTNLVAALLFILVAASASMIHFLARPHVVSWLFSVLWFWILDAAERDDVCGSATGRGHGRFLWLLPLSMIAWVNLHGGFLLGFALLGIYWLSAVWRWIQPCGDRFEDVLRGIRAARQARELALVGAMSAVATFINPYSWRLHVHIYRYLSNRFLMDHIEEFQSPNFHGVAQKCFALLLLLTLVGLAAKGRGLRSLSLSQPLLVLFAVYSGLYASRNIPVSALILILVIGPVLCNALRTLAESRSKPQFAAQGSVGARSSFFSRMQAIDSGLRGHVWPLAAVVVACVIAFHGGRLGSARLMDAHFDAKRFPVGAVDYLEPQHAQGPIFGPDSWGGYFIYRLYPRVKVGVDDRHDFYGEEFLKGYLKTMHVEPGWQDFLDEHPAGSLVVPRDSALASILLETPRWRPVYSDDVATVFESTESVGP